MQKDPWERRAALGGLGFVVLAIAGNALMGSTPALHGEAAVVAEFYEGEPTRISIGMSLSLISLFFLAFFLGVLRRVLAAAEGPDGWLTPVAWGGGMAALALLAAGFALNAVGALRARADEPVSPEAAAVFYDGSMALTGLAATLAMAVLLAATAAVSLRAGALPRWFGVLSAVLALLGVVTPVSFLLFLLFPLWVLVASVLLARRHPAAARTS